MQKLKIEYNDKKYAVDIECNDKKYALDIFPENRFYGLWSSQRPLASVRVIFVQVQDRLRVT